jgi:hypothetical protein
MERSRAEGRRRIPDIWAFNVWPGTRLRMATARVGRSSTSKGSDTESTDLKGDGMGFGGIYHTYLPPQLTAKLFIPDAVQPRHAQVVPRHAHSTSAPSVYTVLSVSYAARCSRGSTCASCSSCSPYCGPPANLMRCDHYRKTSTG